MKRTTLLGLAMSCLVYDTKEMHRYGPVTAARDSLGPDKTAYANRPKKGKGERKANRANRWG